MAIIFRPYQSDAIEFCRNHQRALIHAPAGSGKTIIAAGALDYVAFKDRRALWVCNTVEQQAQAEKALRELDIHHFVRVACVAGEPSLDGYQILVVDEAHHAPAATWSKLIEDAIERKMTIWGFTATPWHYRDEDRNEKMKEFFPAVYQVVRDEVATAGHLVSADVIFHDPSHGLEEHIRRLAISNLAALEKQRAWASDEFIQRRHREILWKWTQFALRNDRERNDTILKILSTTGVSTLALFSTIEHMQRIEAELGQMGVDSATVFSGLGAKVRRDRIAAFRAGDNRVLLATSLADEGLDVPIASRLVLALGGRSPQKLEQRVGRVLRPYPGKDRGEIHDFLDSSSQMAHAQAVKRAGIYWSAGFNVTGIKPPKAKATGFNSSLYSLVLKQKAN